MLSEYQPTLLTVYSEYIMKIQKSFVTRKIQKGATVIEYALIAALVSVAAIVAFSAVGTKVNTTMSNVSTTMG